MSETQEVQEEKGTAPELIFSYLASTDKAALFEISGDIRDDIEGLIKLSDRINDDYKFGLGYSLGEISAYFKILRTLIDISYTSSDVNHISELKNTMIKAIVKLVEAYFALTASRPVIEIDNILMGVRIDTKDAITAFIEKISKSTS